jgi:hypothetical protein
VRLSGPSSAPARLSKLFLMMLGANHVLNDGDLSRTPSKYIEGLREAMIVNQTVLYHYSDTLNLQLELKGDNYPQKRGKGGYWRSQQRNTQEMIFDG